MGVSEADVGIRQYANGLPGFTGILKHRYTDFKVNEVDHTGGVVRLTSLAVPGHLQQQQDACLGTAEAGTSALADVEAAVSSVARLAGNAQQTQVREFLQLALAWQSAPRDRGLDAERSARPKVPSPLTLNPIPDKETRKAVHQLFKSLEGFPPLETVTVAPPPEALHTSQQQGQMSEQRQTPEQVQEQGQQRHGGAAAIAAQPLSPQVWQQGGSPDQLAADEDRGGGVGSSAAAAEERAAGDWAAAGPLQCIQVRVSKRGDRGSGGGRGGQGQKRKWQQVAGWAGAANDYVHFVLYKENMDSQVALSTLARLLRLNHKVFGVAGTKDKRGVTVQAVSAYRVDPVRLAELNPRLRGMRVGNFQLCSKGLWLGDLRGNRFDIILRNVQAGSADLVEAAAQGLRRSGFVNYFGLQRFGSGAVPTHRIGQTLLRGQWQEAVRLIMMPREDARPEVLAACRTFQEEGDVAGALQQMPRHLVAECAILQGLKQHGPSQPLQALTLIPRNLRTMYLHAYQSYLWNMAASHRVSTYPHHRPVAGDLVVLPPPSAPSGAGAAGTAGGGTVQEPPVEVDGEVAASVGREKGSVHVVTEAEAAAGVYHMEDVVLPLPGWQIQYPQHSTAEVYAEVARQDGVSLTEAPHGTKEFMLTELPGGYRRVIHYPSDLQYEVVRYNDPDQELAMTDLMQLEGRELPPPEPEGMYLGLRLSFQLPTSCYATMLIRELTKMNTTTAYQKSLQH